MENAKELFKMIDIILDKTKNKMNSEPQLTGIHARSKLWHKEDRHDQRTA